MIRLLLILPFFIIYSCGDSSKVRINGKIDGGKDKIIYFEKLEVAGPKVLDSVKIKSTNSFSFSVRISEPSFYRLRLEPKNFITLLVEPGEKISIEARAANLPGTYQVSGSEGSELMKNLNDRLTTTKKQMTPLIREIIALEENPVSVTEEEVTRISEELNEIINSQRNFSIAFILDNIESLAAITALYQQIDEENYVLNKTRDIQYLKIVAESLKKKYPNSPHVKALAADAENQERQYEAYRIMAMAEESGQVITTFPDIAMPGIDGDTINLHSLQEKYILLFFGSSLNSSSIKFSHDLIPIFRAYHTKGFQIYHVSVEKDRDEWIRSIQYSELPWIHVAELNDGTFSAARLYNVQQIPSNYLIKRDIGVIARNMSAPELRHRLARALD